MYIYSEYLNLLGVIPSLMFVMLVGQRKIKFLLLGLLKFSSLETLSHAALSPVTQLLN